MHLMLITRRLYLSEYVLTVVSTLIIYVYVCVVNN